MALRIKSVALCGFLFALRAFAVSEPGSKPVPGNPQGNYILPGVLGDIAYKKNLALDAYAPPGNPRPAAMVIHGSRGSKITHVTQLFEPLARAGYAWFSVDWRTVQDLADAAGYIRCAGRFNINRKMVLIGEDTSAQAGGDIRPARSHQDVAP